MSEGYRAKPLDIIVKGRPQPLAKSTADRIPEYDVKRMIFVQSVNVSYQIYRYYKDCYDISTHINIFSFINFII